MTEMENFKSSLDNMIGKLKTLREELEQHEKNTNPEMEQSAAHQVMAEKVGKFEVEFKKLKQDFFEFSDREDD